MPYKCVHCSRLYEDGAKEVLSGCADCGRKFFFYIKKEKLNEIKEKREADVELEHEEKEKIEEDVREIAGVKDEEAPVFLDFESVKVTRRGKYLLDVSKLFSGKPRVYQLEDGKYIVDFSGTKKIEGKDNLKK
jgi:predicted  nucleic acid-binding Zn-ribbon protein